MKLMRITIPFFCFLITNSVLAGQQDISELKAMREQVIHQYIQDLGKADYQDICGLFSDGATVTSTSRGVVNAVEFFSSFLPDIVKANTEFHQGFVSKEAPNHFAARFHFDFQLKDGEVGEGEYIDEFLFEKNSAKLTQVYMFENLKFNQGK